MRGALLFVCACGAAAPRTPKFGVEVHASGSAVMPRLDSVDVEIERVAMRIEAAGVASAADVRHAASFEFSVYLNDPIATAGFECPTIKGLVAGCYLHGGQMLINTPHYYSKETADVAECTGVDTTSFSHEMIHRLLHVMTGDADASHSKSEWYKAVDALNQEGRARCLAALGTVRQ